MKIKEIISMVTLCVMYLGIFILLPLMLLSDWMEKNE